MRLNKYLSLCGLGSRRSVETFIFNKEITVNKIIIDYPYYEVKNSDIVMYKNKILKPQKFIYLMLNKPIGYVTSMKDKYNKKIITSLIKTNEWVFPVGRLDKNTSGLILFTNDGDLAQKLLSPNKKIEKEYIVGIKQPLTQQQIYIMQKGLLIDNRKTLPAKVEKITISKKEYNKAKSFYKVIITEGKKRQVRKMFAYFRKKVVFLKRTRIGNLHLGQLKEGEYRYLSTKEIKELKLLVKENANIS